MSGMHRVLALLVCMAAFSSCIFAQSGKTITLRMLDGKTGRLIATSDFLVRIDHEQTVHANWVTLNDNGTGKLILPQKAAVFTIQGLYESSMQIYVNCDSAAEKGYAVDRWYAVEEILSFGVAAPNGCGRLYAAKLKLAVKPGEFVFFVRKQSLREQMKEDYSVR